MTRSILYYRLFHASALRAAKLATYSRGLASGAFSDVNGPVGIDRVAFWVVLPGDYGYDSAAPIAGSARLYGEF